MKKIIVLLSIVLLSSFLPKPSISDDEKEIRKVLDDQRIAWNAHDLEGFMKGYWKSDDLKFYGSNGVTYGWDNTLDRYRKAYPSKDHTGTLKFVIKDISSIENGSYYVMGEYHLQRKVGDANGIFMIIFKKINGHWKIIADTSC